MCIKNNSICFFGFLDLNTVERQLIHQSHSLDFCYYQFPGLAIWIFFEPDMSLGSISEFFDYQYEHMLEIKFLIRARVRVCARFGTARTRVR